MVSHGMGLIPSLVHTGELAETSRRGYATDETSLPFRKSTVVVAYTGFRRQRHFWGNFTLCLWVGEQVKQ
jgi:hypothetical protein